MDIVGGGEIMNEMRERVNADNVKLTLKVIRNDIKIKRAKIKPCNEPLLKMRITIQ